MAAETLTTLCRMCNDRCGLTVTVDDGIVVKVTGTPGHPWNDGKLCAKGLATAEFVNAPDRLKRPLKRVGDAWIEIPLETALDEIAARMDAVKETHGARSVAVWKGEAIGFAQQELLARRFCHAWGTPNYFSNDSACFCSRWIASSLVYGTGLIPDYENSNCVTLWGSNPANSHPFHFAKIQQARKRDAKLIVVDSLDSEVARSADLHLKPRVGTDGALAWGIMHVLVNEELWDKEFVRDFTKGFEELAAYGQLFTPEMTEKETGVPGALLVEAARLMASRAPKCLIYAGNGLEHHVRGTENLRAIACIDALLGAIDRPGGNRLADPFPIARLSLYHENPLDDLEPIGAKQYPLLYEFRQECHTVTGIDAMLTGQPYPVRALVLTAANPVLSHPRSDKVARALAGLDLLVVRDLFLTETAQLAHYVLPAASFLERSELHVDPAHNRVQLTKKVLTRPETQDEYTFWRDLARRLGIEEHFAWEDETELNRWMLQNAAVDLEDIAADPLGYNFGPLRYEKWRNLLFRTRSGRVEFASSTMADYGFRRLPEYPLPAPGPGTSLQFPFLMVSGSRQKSFVGSRYRNLPKLARVGVAARVELSASDAAELGIREGDLVEISSKWGAIELPAAVLSPGKGQPGVVSVPFGWAWANVNLLTPDDHNDPVTGFPSLKAVPVSIVALTRNPGQSGPISGSLGLRKRA